MRLPIAPTPETDPVGYLMQIKFPGFPYEEISAVNCDGKIRDLLIDRNERSEKLYEELTKKTLDELRQMCAIETERLHIERLAKIENEEKQRFFSQPSANADLSYWAKMSHWSLDEAIALSFGKNPRVVNWESIKPFVKVSTFAVEYERRRDLTLRAVPWNRLYDPVLPGLFLAWAKGLEISVPSDLEGLVIKFGGNIGDFKTAYESLEKSYKTLQAQYEDHIGKLKGMNETTATEIQKTAMEVIESLKLKLTEANATCAELRERLNAPPGSWPWGEHETELLRHLAEAAKQFWALYDSSDNSTAPTNQQVTDWLVNRGVAQRNAEIMATILRADGLPSGPRK